MDSSATEAEQSLSIMIPMSSLCVDCASNLGFAVAFATPSSPPGEMSFYVCYPAPSSGSVSVDGQKFCFESGTKMRIAIVSFVNQILVCKYYLSQYF